MKTNDKWHNRLLDWTWGHGWRRSTFALANIYDVVYKMRRKLIEIIALGLISAWTIQPLHAQLVTQTDITGTGAAVAICVTTTITPACGNAKWVQIIAPTTNAAVVRFGDSTVSATKGAAIAAGGGMYLSPSGAPYALPAIFLFVANGDKVTITWGL